MATKEELKSMDPDEIFSWEVPELDAALKELGIQMGKTWTKSKKAYELSKALEASYFYFIWCKFNNQKHLMLPQI